MEKIMNPGLFPMLLFTIVLISLSAAKYIDPLISNKNLFLLSGILLIGCGVALLIVSVLIDITTK